MLAPDQAAYVRLNKYRCDEQSDDTAAVVSLVPPGGNSALKLAIDSTVTQFTSCPEPASLGVGVSPLTSSDDTLGP